MLPLPGTVELFPGHCLDNVAKILHKRGYVRMPPISKHLTGIGGIKESIVEKIIEYLNTGKIETFEN